jgi:hypothetical protein
VSKKSRKSILDYFPYESFQLGQRELLLQLEQGVLAHDVILLICPTAFGKFAIRRTLAEYMGNVAELLPNNSILEQDLEEQPLVPKLLSKQYYHCDYCRTVDREQVRKAIRTKRPFLCNYWSYLANRRRHGARAGIIDRGVETLLVDEGHKLVDFNKGLQAEHIWQKEVRYPKNINSSSALVKWIDEVILEPDGRSLTVIKKLTMFRAKLLSGDYIIRKEMGLLRGKHESEILLLPLNPVLHPACFQGVNRIVLLSATVSQIDIADLGISKGVRVLQIEAPSPIPIERRPIVKDYVGKLNYMNQALLTPKLADRIEKYRLRFKHTKGLVHVSYSLAAELRKYLGDNDNYYFHDSSAESRRGMFKAWKSSKKRGIVFIASGYNEGINLKGSDYGWQCIGKIMYLSLADLAVKKKSELTPQWYIWNTLKSVMQAAGRICRGPKDKGVTIVLDGQFDGLIEEADKYNLVPKWFKESIVEEDGTERALTILEEMK